MKRAHALAVVLALTASLAACSSGGKKGGDAKKADTPTTSARVSPPATTKEQAAIDLEALLLKTVPSGYVQQDDSVGDTGPSDFAKAVRDDGNDDASEVLARDKFVKGYQRYWMKDTDDNVIVVFLYLFGSADGAHDYDQVMRDQFDPSQEEGVHVFDVAGIPDALGLTAVSAEGNAAVIQFQRDGYVVQVNVQGADASQATVQALATEQYKNLA